MNYYYRNNNIVFPYLMDMTINGSATNQSITSIPEALDFRRDMAAMVSPKSTNIISLQFLLFIIHIYVIQF